MEREYRFEMHYHTKETSPCADMAAEDGIRQYKDEGYDGIIVTDHFTADVEGRSGQCGWQEAADCRNGLQTGNRDGPQKQWRLCKNFLPF